MRYHQHISYVFEVGFEEPTQLIGIYSIARSLMENKVRSSLALRME